jgi:hypothetical protein
MPRFEPFCATQNRKFPKQAKQKVPASHHRFILAEGALEGDGGKAETTAGPPWLVPSAGIPFQTEVIHPPALSGRWHVAPAHPESRHRSLKSECIRRGTPLSQQDAERLIQQYVDYDNKCAPA